jgi:transcriptional regulator with XRE-family HTH domain
MEVIPLESVQDRIKARRKELCLSADQVAEALGVSRATVYRYESAEIEKLPAVILKPLAEVLHTTPAYLMGWDDTSSCKQEVFPLGEIRKVIGENIKKICKIKGIRQIDIAEHMGISQGSVSNWIKGTNSIDIENLAELCSFLGVSLDQIYGVAPLEQSITLTPGESELLSLYRSVTAAGQDHILSTARMVAGNPDMLKGGSVGEAIS